MTGKPLAAEARPVAKSAAEMLSDEPGKERVSPAAVVAVAALLWLTSQVQRVELAAFVGGSSLLADFEITAAGAGLLVGIYFPLYGLMQIPSGILADVWRPKRILLISGLLTGLTTVALAVAPSLPVAVVARGATGVASGFLWLPALKLYSRLPGVSYGRAVSVLVAVGSAGTVLGLAAIPAAAAVWPWRIVALLTAISPALACLALALTPVPEAAGTTQSAARSRGRTKEETDEGPLRQAQGRLFGSAQGKLLTKDEEVVLRPSDSSFVPSAGSGQALRRSSPVRGRPSFLHLLGQSWVGVRRVATTPEYWVLFLPTMLWNGANFAIVGWLPRYARDALGLPAAATGILPALLPLGQIVGSTTIGFILGRRARVQVGSGSGRAAWPGTLPLFFCCIVVYGLLFTALLSGALGPLVPLGGSDNRGRAGVG